MDHILTNSPEKLFRAVLLKMELSDHELINYSRKTSLLKLNEDYEISFWPMKKYSGEIFVDDQQNFLTIQTIPA